MKPFKTYAFIQSLNIGRITCTKQDEVEIIDKLPNNQYIAKYRGILCTAIFNCFSNFAKS